MRVDDNGWLIGDAADPVVKRYPTVRTYPLTTTTPLGLVWHTTDGTGGPGYAEMLAQGARRFRPGVDRPASWHVLIARDGAIYQSASFQVGTWHVGKPGVIAGKKFSNINFGTIGIELENAGRLRRVGDRVYFWPYYVNPNAPSNERRVDPALALPTERGIVTAAGLFDGFPPAQEGSAAAVVGALVARYRWTREVCSYGHVEFDPEHREDPGPIWKETVLPRVLNRVFGSAASASPRLA